MKIKKLGSLVSKVYRLSEDYDSDSDSDSDDDNDRWLVDSNAVAKKLKKVKHARLQKDGKVLKLLPKHAA